MKYDPQLPKYHATKILLKNINGLVAFLLKGFTVITLKKLDKSTNLQEKAKRVSFC